MGRLQWTVSGALPRGRSYVLAELNVIVTRYVDEDRLMPKTRVALEELLSG